MEINMKLYFAPNSRAVRIAWLLEELGLEYEVEKYSVGDRALRTPEYYKIHLLSLKSSLNMRFPKK